MPRLDVFSQPRPLPTSQGTEVWSWNGYVNWADDKVPPLPHFTHHTNRRSDFYPTFNQTRYTLERTDAPLALQVYLETRTPGFDCFLARIDGETWRESPDRFTWTLHSGLNLLELRTRNRVGVEGMISAAAVEA